MNKPKTPANNKVVFNAEGALIIRNHTEEFGTTYYLFHESIFGTLAFGTLESALEAANNFKEAK